MALDPHEPQNIQNSLQKHKLLIKNHWSLKHIPSPELGRNLSKAFKRFGAISR